jgi:hypothetical protein
MDFTNPAMAEELNSVTIDPDEVLELRRILDAHAKGQLS